MFLVIVVTGTAPALPATADVIEARCAVVAPRRAFVVDTLSRDDWSFRAEAVGEEVARGRLTDMAPFAAASDLSSDEISAGAGNSDFRWDSERSVLNACVAAEFPGLRSLLCFVEARLALNACVAAELPHVPSRLASFLGEDGCLSAADADPTASRAALRPVELVLGSQTGAIL